MKRLTRPLLTIALLSFILGIWYSISVWENGLNGVVSEPIPITLLVMDENPWRALLPGTGDARVRVQILKVEDPDRFEEVLRGDTHSCDLVALNSLYARYFIEKGLIKKWEIDKLTNVNLINADFRNFPFDPQGDYFLPLYWTVAQWRQRPTAKPIENFTDLLESNQWKGKVLINSLAEDLLSVALDLSLLSSEGMGDEESEAPPPDTQTPYHRLREAFSITQDAEELKDRTLARFLTSAKPEGLSEDWQPPVQANQDDLILIGLAPCANSRQFEASHTYLDWLLLFPAYFQSVTNSRMASTLLTSEHQSMPPEKKASGLRALSLNRLHVRETPWELMRLWLKTAKRQDHSQANRQ